MDVLEMEALLKSVDQRLHRVEQILPTLATKADIRDLLPTLATKADIRDLLPTLATKEDIRGLLPTLATKEDIRALLPTLATKVEVREEGERTRRYFDIVAERLRDDIRIIAEGQAHLAQRVEDFRIEIKTDIANLDRRVMRLEAAPKRR